MKNFSASLRIYSWLAIMAIMAVVLCTNHGVKPDCGRSLIDQTHCLTMTNP